MALCSSNTTWRSANRYTGPPCCVWTPSEQTADRLEPRAVANRSRRPPGRPGASIVAELARDDLLFAASRLHDFVRGLFVVLRGLPDLGHRRQIQILLGVAV